MLNREGVFWFANDQTVRDEKFSIARYLRCGNHNPADIFVTRFDYSTVEGSTGTAVSAGDQASIGYEAWLICDNEDALKIVAAGILIFDFELFIGERYDLLCNKRRTRLEGCRRLL
jgi:hypothetical protein